MVPQSDRLSRGDIAFVLFSALLLVGIIAGVLLVVTTRPAPVEIRLIPPQATATGQPTLTPGPLTVYVTGAVLNPNQLVSVPPGSRVQAAIAAAGGLSERADPAGVNLAGVLRDGDQIFVPALGETAAVLPTALTSGIVAINRATPDELMTLPGIGQATADAIIAYREANGPFTDLAGLDNVDGIGARTLETLAALISFE